ncbi:unnamed protein product [Rotaria socialis]|uniref:Uncharacterized protein n=3 Tax=Rotaria socialis TaxID=392032 RepID=A0A818G2E0_9BILA|nr:unnamed protein product [Rotaria socialis]CAF3483957.1 unnamed protein product [Rotaria socialis]CAF3485230.1 unnamed protein product [Rotaria socialis]CAF4224044.1 unnamed protein product [Rotaria socialis]CAF4448740.1 unnamed protein product [Rotaria socialis]
MLRERTTSYLRHFHLVVHSEQQRLSFPVYVIQQEELSPPVPQHLESSNETKLEIFRNYLQKKSFKFHHCIPLSFLILCLIAAIALLSSLVTNTTSIEQCPIYDCSLMNTTTYSTISNMTTSYNLNISNDISFVTNWNTSISSTVTSTSTTILDRNLVYGDNCIDYEQCTLSKHLLCQYEFDLNQKHCFCETTYFWNKKTQQCEPKKDVNEICEYDNECRLDLGVTCDLKTSTNIGHCRCMGEYYWSKISNCGALKIQDFVHCTDEIYISSCLVKEIDNGIYHNVNIRQIQDDEIEFDYFIVDSPEIQEIERIECCWSISKRYCFGIDSETNRLLIVIIDINGIESYHHINQSVIGLPNVLRQADNSVVCYIEGDDSNLFSITIDPKNNDLLTVHQRGGKTYGERSCFIAINRTTYCFYRDIDHHLTVVTMNGTTTAQDAHMHIHSETNLKTGPSCGWVGVNILLKLYCFTVFNDEKIHRIEQKNNIWSNWMIMSSDKIFIQRPLFVTSKPPEDASTDQSCHVLAIDTSNEVYVSSNTDCTHETSFSAWSLLQTDIGLLSFNGSFRLRDGRIGVYGIGIDDLPYYTTMNPVTHSFEPIKLATTFE